MKQIIFGLLSLSMAVWCLAMAVTLGTVDSAFIDFTVMAQEQLELYRYGFFSGFVAFMLGTAYAVMGDSI